MSKAYFKQAVIAALRLDLAVSVFVKTIEYVRENHPRIYDKAFIFALDSNKEKIDNLNKALDEGKDNAKVQEEDNPTHGVR